MGGAPWEDHHVSGAWARLLWNGVRGNSQGSGEGWARDQGGHQDCQWVCEHAWEDRVLKWGLGDEGVQLSPCGKSWKCDKAVIHAAMVLTGTRVFRAHLHWLKHELGILASTLHSFILLLCNRSQKVEPNLLSDLFHRFMDVWGYILTWINDGYSSISHICNWTFVFPLPGSAAWCCVSGPAYAGYHGADDTWGPQKLPEIIKARHRGESWVAGWFFISSVRIILNKTTWCWKQQAISLSCPSLKL